MNSNYLLYPFWDFKSLILDVKRYNLPFIAQLPTMKTGHLSIEAYKAH